MYNNVKLEKGLYNLSGKSFSQALEALDPSENYSGTSLENLDAFERQLKRFNIKVSGSNCDMVEKFFTTTESAVLFPEFVRRCIQKGFDDSLLNSIVAVSTKCESNIYSGCTITDTASYSTTPQGSNLPTASVTEPSTSLTLSKYGRMITASYEALRQQKLDVFGVMLRSIGIKLANSILGSAVTALKSNITASTTSSLNYSALTNLYGSFSDFNMNCIIMSPKNTASVLALTQMENSSADKDGKVKLPFGAEIICTPKVSDNTIIGLDKDFALEMITSSDIVLETDKLISNQLDRIAVSVNCGFRKITDDAVKVLTISSN